MSPASSKRQPSGSAGLPHNFMHPVYAEQVEVLWRLRRGPDQIIRIDQVDVHDGGQAIVGGVKTGSQ